MESSERDEGRNNEDTSEGHNQSDKQPANDTTPHTTEGDAANASASDADAGDLSGSGPEE